MTVSAADLALHEVLVASQRSGFLGDRPIDEVIDHARHFVSALDGVDLSHHRPRVLDLGSGGGVPGLVIAHDRPDVDLTLFDRRAKRTDFLERVVRRLEWRDRVTVICGDVDRFTPPVLFDATVARGFGPPVRTLTVATTLTRVGGHVLISEPPTADRWEPEVMDRVGVEHVSAPGSPVVVFRRR